MPDLFAPGKDKEFFYIFDYCQNLEYFSQSPETSEGSLGESLGKRLFKMRLELVSELDRKSGDGSVQEAPENEAELRRDVVAMLHREVAAMNLENFIVRTKRRLVEKYAKPEAWTELKAEAHSELAHEVAGLPSELEAEEEEAKRFDLLILRLQLAVLRAEPAFKRLGDQVRTIAGLLEEKASIPMVHAQLLLIQEIQTDEWWQDVTVPMLETARRRLRSLVKLIEKQARKPIYTDFEDEIGDNAAMALPGFADADSFEKFRDKARAFLRSHQDHPTIHKLRMNEPLAAQDLQELEKILAESGALNPDHLAKAKEECQGLGLFVRSLVGMERDAAKQALNSFMAGRTLTANQIEFVNLVVDHLTANGAMKPEMLYESPFTDLNPQGPDGVFNPAQVDALFALLSQIWMRAAA